MFQPIFLAAVFSLSVACAPPSASITREEAREQSSKSDALDVDICLEQNWYGDGEICDDFCLYPDPDCEGNSFCSDDSACDDGTRCNAEELCLSQCGEEGACDEACLGFCVKVPEQESPCGGPLAIECEIDEWCSYSDDPATQRAELTGVCRPLPLLCATVLLPVCGRDGHTYNNECTANRAGVDAIYEGPCEPEVEPDEEPEAG